METSKPSCVPQTESLPVAAPEQSTQDLGKLREQLRGHEGMTPPNIVDGVFRLNVLADEQIGDPRKYRRALAENYRAGIAAVMHAPGERTDALETLNDHYKSIQQMIIGEKEADQSRAEAPASDDEQRSDIPTGFVGSNSTATDSSNTERPSFGFNNDHVPETDPSTS
jgi:hypothetical protein